MHTHSNYAIPGALIFTLSLFHSHSIKTLQYLAWCSPLQWLLPNHYCPPHFLSPRLSSCCHPQLSSEVERTVGTTQLPGNWLFMSVLIKPAQVRLGITAQEGIPNKVLLPDVACFLLGTKTLRRWWPDNLRTLCKIIDTNQALALWVLVIAVVLRPVEDLSTWRRACRLAQKCHTHTA